MTRTWTALFAILLFVGLTLPVTAEVVVQDIVIDWSGPIPEKVNIRVQLFNPEPVTERGPIVVRLYLREDDTVPWREVATWSNIGKIPGGYRVVRDYLPGGRATMDPVLYQGRFEVRATATTPDGREAWREESFPEAVDT